MKTKWAAYGRVEKFVFMSPVARIKLTGYAITEYEWEQKWYSDNFALTFCSYGWHSFLFSVS